MDEESQIPKGVAEQAAGEMKATAAAEAVQQRDAKLPPDVTEVPKLTTNPEFSNEMRNKYGWFNGQKVELNYEDPVAKASAQLDRETLMTVSRAELNALKNNQLFTPDTKNNIYRTAAKKFVKTNPDLAHQLAETNLYVKSALLDQIHPERTPATKKTRVETTPQPEGGPSPQRPGETAPAEPVAPEQTPSLPIIEPVPNDSGETAVVPTPEPEPVVVGLPEKEGAALTSEPTTPTPGEKPPVVEDKPAAPVTVEQLAAQPVEIDTTVGDAEAPAEETGTAKEEPEVPASLPEPLSTDTGKEPLLPPSGEGVPGVTPDTGAPEQIQPAPKPTETLDSTAAAGAGGETPSDDEEPEGEATGDEDTGAGATGEQDQAGQDKQKKPETPEEKAAREQKERDEEEFKKNLTKEQLKEYEKDNKNRDELVRIIKTIPDAKERKRAEALLRARDEQFYNLIQTANAEKNIPMKHVIIAGLFGTYVLMPYLIYYFVQKYRKRS